MEHMVPKFRIADLAFLFCFHIEVSFLNGSSNRARTDLLGQVWLHLTVMNFAQW